LLICLSLQPMMSVKLLLLLLLQLLLLL